MGHEFYMILIPMKIVSSNLIVIRWFIHGATSCHQIPHYKWTFNILQ